MRKILYILSVTFLLAACSGDAIFATLEDEEKIKDLNNFNSNTPVLGLKIYTDGGTDYYIANGRQLWYSEAGASGTDNPWKSVSLDGFSDSESVISVAEHSDRLYFTVSDEDSSSANALLYLSSVKGEPVELFRYNRTDKSGNDYHFHNLYVHSIPGKGMYISKVERSWSSDTNDNSSIVSSSLYYYPDGDHPTSISDLESHELTLPAMDSSDYVVKDVVGAESDSIFLILNQDSNDVDSYKAGKLLVADWATPTSFSLETVNAGEDYSYNNLYYSETYDMLFLSTRGDSTNPICYKSWNGSAWSSWTVYNDGDDDLQFSVFVDLPSSVQANTVLVGTRGDVEEGNSTYYSGKGYRELIISGQTISEHQKNDFSDDNNYESSDLQNSTITALIYDTDRDKMYCGTYDNGLWQNRWSTSKTEWRWYQE
jgi:hypothetical protein